MIVYYKFEKVVNQIYYAYVTKVDVKIKHNIKILVLSSFHIRRTQNEKQNNFLPTNCRILLHDNKFPLLSLKL